MENIFIYMLLVLFSAVLTVSTTKAVNITTAFDAINDNVFLQSIDYQANTNGSEFNLAIIPSKLENNVIKILKNNKISTIHLQLNFYYYNSFERIDCQNTNYVCDGVWLNVKTDINYFYRSREYIYEIQSQ